MLNVYKKDTTGSQICCRFTALPVTKAGRPGKHNRKMKAWCFHHIDFTYLMDHFRFKLNLHLAKKVKSFTTARKSILKLVKLRSLVAKCGKIRKIFACKVCKFCIFLYYALTTKWPKFTRSGKAFPCVIQKYTKCSQNLSLVFGTMCASFEKIQTYVIWVRV